MYKLRNPSASYLASLSTYDSANPTKEWGFPPLSSDWEITHSSKSGESSASASGGVCKEKGLPVLPNQTASLKVWFLFKKLDEPSDSIQTIKKKCAKLN